MHIPYVQYNRQNISTFFSFWLLEMKNYWLTADILGLINNFVYANHIERPIDNGSKNDL